MDQHKNSRLYAFDFESGDEVWKVGRGVVSWSSPILVENRGRKELILTNGKSVDSYDSATGRQLWHVDCMAGEVATSAAYADGIVFVATEGAKATAIDISDHGAGPRILWQWETEALPDASSPVVNGTYLFVPTGFGAVSCLDARSGKVHWEHEFEEGFYSSPILVKDRVYITDFSGNTQVFRIDDECLFEQGGGLELGRRVGLLELDQMALKVREGGLADGVLGVLEAVQVSASGLTQRSPGKRAKSASVLHSV